MDPRERKRRQLLHAVQQGDLSPQVLAGVAEHGRALIAHYESQRDPRMVGYKPLTNTELLRMVMELPDIGRDRTYEEWMDIIFTYAHDSNWREHF